MRKLQVKTRHDVAKMVFSAVYRATRASPATRALPEQQYFLAEFFTPDFAGHWQG